MQMEQSSRGSGQFMSSSSEVVSMASAETTDDAISRIASLQALSVEDLAAFFYSKEGQAEVRGSLVMESEMIRAIAAVGFGRLLLIARDHSTSSDLENFLRFSSISEARRLKEDFADFISDVFRSFSCGVIGRAAASDPLQQLEDSVACVRAYCEVLTDLFDRYNSSRCEFDDSIENILGVPITSCSVTCKRFDAIVWLPFVKKVIIGLLSFGGHQLLVDRWREICWCSEYTRLLSQLFLFLLVEGSTGAGTGTGGISAGGGPGAFAVLDYTTLEKGRSRDSFEAGAGSGAGGSSHPCVPVRRIAEEWVCTLLQQAASINVFESIPAIGEILSYCNVQCGLSEEVKFQALGCVVKHSMRLLRLGERAEGCQPTAHIEDDDTTSFLLCVRQRLIAYILFALQCPNLAESLHLSIDVCFLFSAICTLENNAVKTMLIARGVSYVLSIRSSSAAVSGLSDLIHRSRDVLTGTVDASLKHRLHLVFCHPFVMPFLSPSGHSSNEAFRCRLLASVCVGVERSLCVALRAVNSAFRDLVKESKIVSPTPSDAVLTPLADLLNLLSSVPLILRTFKRCIYWDVGGFNGEAGQLSFVSLISATAAVCFPSYPSSASPSSQSQSQYSASECQLPERIFCVSVPGSPPPLFPAVETSLDGIAADTGQALNAISEMLIAEWGKAPLHSFSVGACVELVYILLVHHVRSAAQDTTAANEEDELLQNLINILRDVLFGTYTPQKSTNIGGEVVGAGMGTGTGVGVVESPFLPGNRTLGQDPSALSPPVPPSAPTLTDMSEVLTVLQAITKHSDRSISNMCRRVLKDFASHSAAGSGTGSALEEKVELLNRMVSSKAPITVPSSSRKREPLSSNICSTRPDRGSCIPGAAARTEEEGESAVLRETADPWGAGGGGRGHGRGVLSTVCVSTVDTIATITAAFSDHDSAVKGQTKGQGQGQGQLQLQTLDSHIGLDPLLSTDALMSCDLLALERGGAGGGERIWTQVSGSGDLLTVLVSHSQADTSRGGWDAEVTDGTDRDRDRGHVRRCVAHVQVLVRVTNTSGFKVPAFSVGLVLVPGEEGSGGLSAVTIAPTLPSGNSSTLMGADGLVEYMLPGSAVEKQFTVEVRRVCSFDAVVRLSYPDLAVEESDSGDAFFVCPATSHSMSSPSRGGGSRAGAIAAETDCAPIHIEFWSFCRPLRAAHSAPTQGQVQIHGHGQGQSGLSAEEFAVLWDLLPYSAFISTTLPFCAHEMGTPFQNSPPSSSSSSSSADPYRVECPSSSSSSSSSHRLSAWAMKTLWGSTVALRIEDYRGEHDEGTGTGIGAGGEHYSVGNGIANISLNGNRNSYGQGHGQGTSDSAESNLLRNSPDKGRRVRVAVRCGDSNTLSALVQDGLAIIDALL